MGCWNDPYNPGTPFKKVAAAIMADDTSDVVVIGGDNIYPKKLAGVKTYNLDKLKEGIGAFLGKRIYAALGNHNVGDPAIEQYELGEAPWTMPAKNYMQGFSDYNLVVINTNALDACLPFLRQIPVDKPYFLVQHEPMISIRENKKMKGVTRVDVLTGYDRLLPILVTNPPIAILCADTHNYQHGIVEFGGAAILQYTVGTGGAVPDPFTEGFRPDPAFKYTPKNTHDIGYRVLDVSSMYGYLRIRDRAAIEFVAVAAWSGGSRRRSCRKRRLRRFRSRTRVEK